MSTQADSLTNKSGGKTIRLSSYLSASPALILLLVAALVFWMLEPRFISVYNLTNIAEQSATIGIMAIGLALVLLLGGIDLSIPAIMASAAVLGAIAMVATQNPWLGAPVMILVGLAGGAFNAFAVTILKLVPFAVTLATMTLAGGFAVWMTEGTSIYGMPYQFSLSIMSRIMGVPISVILFVIIALAVHWVVKSGLIGRHIFFIGTSRSAARVSGVPIQKVEFGCYLFSGLTAGLAAILLTGRLDSAAASMGSDAVVLDVVAAAVIGGVSIYGGRGTVLGAALGAVFITAVGNGLNLLGYDYFTAIVIKGSVILLAIGLDSAVTRYRRGAMA